MPPQERPLAPKPYELLPFPADKSIERTRPVGHHRFEPDRLSGRLSLEAEALTPVHVASGLMEAGTDRRYPLVKSLLRVGATPTIPGSSFKGCVRSIVEAITPSCIRVTRAPKVPGALGGCRDKEKLCLACQLFGAQDFQGLLRFSDLSLQDDPAQVVRVAEVPSFYRPRSQEKVYYHEQGGIRGRKFYLHGSQQAKGNTPIEVCWVGSRFAGRLDFHNLEPAHLGLLLVALGQHPDHPLWPKLGGAKPACYGSLQVIVQRLDLFDARAQYSAWDGPAEDTEHDPARFLREAGGLLREPQLRQLTDILRWPTTRECPSGNY